MSLEWIIRILENNWPMFLRGAGVTLWISVVGTILGTIIGLIVGVIRTIPVPEKGAKKGVLRGLHFQTKHTQGKLVRVTQGEVWDVAVDLRKGSPTFGQWEGVYLSAENKRQFYVPEGFAHGFVVLSDEAVFNYKCTDFYAPEYDSGLLWNDKDVNVEWPLEGIEEIILSEKDKKQKTLKEIGRAHV